MENKFHKIFVQSECISEEAMLAYIKGTLSSKEKYTVEKHLLHCDFCADAMEGLQLVNDETGISEIIADINKKQPGKSLSTNRKSFGWIRACVLPLPLRLLC